jgi:hypothetical protein
MKTIKIRELRGSTVEEYARAGELVGLTRDRALIAVVVPMVQAWVEHMIDHNWSRVMQSVAAAEEDLNREDNVVNLDDVLAKAATEPSPSSSPQPRGPIAQFDDVSRSGDHAVAASAEHSPEMIKRLAAAFDMDSKAGAPDITSTSTIGIRDLSAHRIEQAGQARELLVLTNDRLVIGLVVPISPRLVEFLISQNLSRVIYNIQVAEQRVAEGEPFVTLDEVLADNPSDHPEAAHDPTIPAPRDRRVSERTRICEQRVNGGVD